MRQERKLRVGIVGVGGIANGAHIPGYLEGDITAICDIDAPALARTGDRCGILPERRFVDYRDLIACEDVDVVDICTPDYLHCEVAKAAIAAGKPFSTEKPMARSYREALETSKLAAKAGVPGFICFTWRFRPYIRFLKAIVDRGEIGELYHIYIRCIKNSGLWEGRRLEWRFDEAQSCDGVLGDLASHMIDITRFLGEELKQVTGDGGIFVKARQRLDSDEFAPVTTYDWVNIIAKTQSGANATYQISRTATGIGDWTQVELYGTRGKAIYRYEDGSQSLHLALGKTDLDGKGMHEVVPPASFDANQSQAFLQVASGRGDGIASTIEEGVACQRALDAVKVAIKEKRWVNVSQIN